MSIARRLTSRITLMVGMATLVSCGHTAESEPMTDKQSAESDTSGSSSGIETPAYTVLKTSPAPGTIGDRIELREYAPKLAARVTVTADNPDQASSRGFRPLADFIFGNNAPREEVAMTAPVTTTPSSGEQIAMTAPVLSSPDNGPGQYTVEFVMPSQYTMETLPRPVNDAVRIERVGERTVVAAGYIGQRSPARVEELQEAIRAFVAAQGLEVAGPFAQAGYSGPSVPTNQRKWEVHLPVTR